MIETASPQSWCAPEHSLAPARSITSRENMLRIPRYWWVGVVICAVAAGSLVFFYTQGLTNLCGDAIAHMEGARRLWDSRTPGYEEIGSVWLPVFHILAAPLTLSDSLWRSGLAGSLVSTAALSVTAWILFHLGLELNCCLEGGVVALAVFLLCPSMLYLAS